MTNFENDNDTDFDICLSKSELDIEMNIIQNECLICFEEHNQFEYPCESNKHYFCIHCIKNWYKTCKQNGQIFNCPVCKIPINDEFTQLYKTIIQSELNQQIQNPETTENTNNNINDQEKHPFLIILFFFTSALFFIGAVMSKDQNTKIYLFIFFFVFFFSFIYLLYNFHPQNRISPIY